MATTFEAPFLTETVQEAEDLIVALNDAGHRLSDAIAAERLAYEKLQDMQHTEQAVQAEVVMEAEIAGADGALAGIAKTSKAYGYAINHLLDNDDRMVGVNELLVDYKREHLQASIERQQAEVMFKAVRHASELKAAILKAVAS